MGFNKVQKIKLLKKTYSYKRGYKCRCSYCIKGKSHDSSIQKLKADSTMEDITQLNKVHKYPKK